MPVIRSQLNSGDATFQANVEANKELVNEFRELEARVRENSAKKIDKFRKRNQLLPRERIDVLLDPGTPFIELSTLAGLNMHDDDGKDHACGGGNIVGIGTVAGVRCLVYAHDSAIKGGAVTPMGLEKSLRAQKIAMENKLPMITLAESAGANLMYQAEIFVNGGRVFANMARMSAAGIPQITVVHGSSTAGGAYLPGLSDYVIMIREKSKVFLAGPPLVKAAIGEEATDEELGGADLHATVSGSAEYLADDDKSAIAMARDVASMLPWSTEKAEAEKTFQEPLYSQEELLGIIPQDQKTPFDAKEIIARIVDGSEFLEFKKLFGPQTICGHARIKGMTVGVITNNGPIYPDGSVKAAQFIQLCSQANTPLLFLHNTTGYMVGTEAERLGAIKHGSKMIQAVANAPVPKISIIVGGSFGAGNYGMCGRAYDPRFCFAWPGSRVSVMGGEQAAKVMEIITQQKFERMGQTAEPEVLAMLGDKIKKQFDSESTALFATARLWDDGIIDPRDTRNIIAECLAICEDADQRELKPSTFGVARM